MTKLGSGGHVDYSLARKATLMAYRAGRLSRYEICDAHPDLIRAARFCGERTGSACPVCDSGALVLVRYVFSDAFSARENGRVWTQPDVGPLAKLGEVRLYTVEVCPSCSWNHVRSQVAFGTPGGSSGSGQRRVPRAST